MNWWEFPVSQGFGQSGERGVDLSTPLHTPISALFGGQVTDASCGHPWGCELGINADVPGHGSQIEYFLHLDQLSVAPGQSVSAGQLVGLSGGQLSGGNYPNSPSVSSGPHIEVGFFTGKFWGPSFDPLAIVRGGPSGGGGGPDLGAAAGNAANLVTGGVAGGIAAAGQAIGQGMTAGVTTLGHGIADAFAVGVHDAELFVHRQAVALFVAVLVLLVLFH